MYRKLSLSLGIPKDFDVRTSELVDDLEKTLVEADQEVRK